MKPWERYQQQPAAPAGPWAKYGQQSAPEQEPSFSERAMGKVADFATSAMFPHRMIAGAVADLPGSLAEAGRSMLGTMGEEGPKRAKQLMELSETEYRMLAPSALGIEPASPEAKARWRDVLAEVLITGAGGKAGQVVGSRIGDVGRYIGRGFRTVPGAERFLSQYAGAAPAAASPTVRELIDPTLSGALAYSIVDAMDPTPYELTDKPVAGGAGMLTAAAVGKNTIDDLLISNPKWRQIMMSPSSGRAGALIGALLANQGYNLTKGAINAAVDKVAEVLKDEEPYPQVVRYGNLSPRASAAEPLR